MRKIVFAFLPLLAVMAVACNGGAKGDVRSNPYADLLQVDPLTKVVPDMKLAVQAVDSIPVDTIRVARGENATVQIQVYAKETLKEVRLSVKSPALEGYCAQTLPTRTLGWIHTVQSTYRYWPGAPDAIPSTDYVYPDPIIVKDTEPLIEAGDHRGAWLDFDIPAEALAGCYYGEAHLEAEVNGKTASWSHPIYIQVYDVTLTPQRLLVTNWTSDTPSKFLNDGKEVEYGSPLYWELKRKVVHMARDYGSNAWRLLLSKGNWGGIDVTLNAAKDGFAFDFSRWDTEFEFFLKEGNAQQLHGLHFASRNGWVDPFTINVPYLSGDTLAWTGRVPTDDPRIEPFFAALFPALRDHLLSKKLPDGRTWLDIYAQFVGDEPINENLESWMRLAKLIKKYAPEIKIIEAYRSGTVDRSLIDYPIPQLNEFNEYSYYQDKYDSRDQNIWIYTCMFPRENYANRFVELPLLKTRLLHWINYKYNAVGYLHWGLNYWEGVEGDPYGDISVPGNDWPGGDSHIIYPAYHEVYPSMRLAAMRDGIRDYELLRMIEDRDKADAQAFADRMVYALDSYNMDVEAFRTVRREMLDYLAKRM